VFFVGFDATWLWRQNAGDRFFYKFWGQALRFVARSDEHNKKMNWLEVKPVRVSPGDNATLELLAYTATGAPLQQATTTVRIAGAHQATVTLVADPNGKGRYVGTFPVPAQGSYTLTYENTETHWHALLASDEFRNPNVDRAVLHTLSTTTGGRVVELSAPDWPASLLAALHGEARSTRLAPQEATVWDNWVVLMALVGVYALDIGLRRWVGLT
jgi:hypothetical protein